MTSPDATIFMRRLTRSRQVASLILMVVLTAKSACWGQDQPAGGGREILFQQKITPVPALILVPVTINQKQHAFYFDTGSQSQVFDNSLKHLISGQSESRNTAINGTVVSMDYYRAPRMLLGEWEAAPAFVTTADLSAVRIADGRSIPGLIGFDCLENTYVGLDFDRGLLTISKTYPAIPGPMNSVNLNRGKSGALKPGTFKSEVTLRIADRDIPFTIDTGYNRGIGLGHAAFMYFQDWGIIEKAKAVGANFGPGGGSEQLGMGRFTEGSLLGLSLRGMPVTDNGPTNIIGLEILVNFNLVFDLQAGKFLYQKRQCDPPINPAGSLGALVTFPGGKPIVLKTRPGGAVESSGIQEGDEIVSLGELLQKDINMSSLYEFCVKQGGKTVTAKIRRSGRMDVSTMSLTLSPDQWAFPPDILKQ